MTFNYLFTLCCLQLGPELCGTWDQAYCVLSALRIVGVTEGSCVYQSKSRGCYFANLV